MYVGHPSDGSEEIDGLVHGKINRIIKVARKCNTMKSLYQNLATIFENVNVEYRCPNCTNCEDCTRQVSTLKMTMKEHEEEFYIRRSVSYIKEDKMFEFTIPFVKDPYTHLQSNKTTCIAKITRGWAEIYRTQEDPERIDAMARAIFFQMVKSDIFGALDDASHRVKEIIRKSPVQHYMCIALAYKATSINTPVRPCFDCSQRTPSGHSLNSIIAKGKIDTLDFRCLAIKFVTDKWGVACDLHKFYTSCRINEAYLPYQLLMFYGSPDINDKTLKIYICYRAIFGMKSVSRQMEYVMEIIAERHKDNKNFHHYLTQCKYVDDCAGSFGSLEEIETLKKDMEEILSLYGLKIKGWIISGQKSDENMAEDGYSSLAGYIYHSERDCFKIRVPDLQFDTIGKKRGKVVADKFFSDGTLQELDEFVPTLVTVRQLVSKAGQIFDCLGFSNPMLPRKKDLLRRTALQAKGLSGDEKSKWDQVVDSSLRKEWIEYFYDMIQIGKIEYPRFALPSSVDTDGCFLFAFADSSFLCSQECIYIGYTDLDDGLVKTKLIYARNQINTQNSTGIASLELQAAVAAATMLHEVKLKMQKVRKIYLFTDNQVVLWMLQRVNISLSLYDRNRVSAILRLVDKEDIYHVRGDHNPADLGTRITDGVLLSRPDSEFHTGPKFLQDIQKAIEDGIITPYTRFQAPKHIIKEGMERLPGKFNMPDEYFNVQPQVDEIVLAGLTDESNEASMPKLRRSRRKMGLPPLSEQPVKRKTSPGTSLASSKYPQVSPSKTGASLRGESKSSGGEQCRRMSTDEKKRGSDPQKDQQGDELEQSPVPESGNDERTAKGKSDEAEDEVKKTSGESSSAQWEVGERVLAPYDAAGGTLLMPATISILYPNHAVVAYNHDLTLKRIELCKLQKERTDMVLEDSMECEAADQRQEDDGKQGPETEVPDEGAGSHNVADGSHGERPRPPYQRQLGIDDSGSTVNESELRPLCHSSPKIGFKPLPDATKEAEKDEDQDSRDTSNEVDDSMVSVEEQQQVVASEVKPFKDSSSHEVTKGDNLLNIEDVSNYLTCDLGPSPDCEVPPNVRYSQTGPYNVEKTSERFRCHQLPYIVNPITLGWRKAVDTIAMIYLFISRIKPQFRVKRLIAPENLHNFLLYFNKVDPLTSALPGGGSKAKYRMTDIYKNVEECTRFRFIAIQYFLVKASYEATKFLPPAILNKHSYEEKQIRYACTRVSHVSEIKDMLSHFPAYALSIQKKLPFLDRYSPVSIALVHYCHASIKHRGVDATSMELVKYAYIYKGKFLITSIVTGCLYCRRKNHKFISTPMGPIHNRMFYSPVNYHTMIDVAGPFYIQRGPKYNLRRGNNAGQQKVYVLVSCCIITHYVQAGILLDYSAAEFLSCFVRFSNTTGYPARVYMDNSASQLRGLDSSSDFQIGDVVSGAAEFYKIQVVLCGVGGASHARHGLIERKIGVVKQFLSMYHDQIRSLSYTGLDTLLHASSAYINSCPLALTERRDGMTSAEFITPMTFLMGARSSYRSPLTIPLLTNRSQALMDMDKLSRGLSKFYSAHLTSFLLRQKWNTGEDDPLREGDLVLMEHNESRGPAKYKLAEVTGITKDSDCAARLITLQYSNSSEVCYPVKGDDNTVTRVVKHSTRRATNRLVKIYTITDRLIDSDLRALAQITP